MTNEKKLELLMDFGSYIDLANRSCEGKTKRKAFYWRAIGMQNALEVLEIKISNDLKENLANAGEELGL